MTQYVLNSLLGATLLTLGCNLFYYVHKNPLNLSDLFYVFTVLRPSMIFPISEYLMQYLPVVSGIFFISGVLFDAMTYQSVGTIAPYGPEETILQRSSMYGFAIGAFLMGFGGQLASGDIIFHSCSQIAKGKWFSNSQKSSKIRRQGHHRSSFLCIIHWLPRY